jgi:phosphohistidine phosphatase
MDLFLIRHADAAPLGEGGNGDDAERPLTPAGRAQCKPLAEALLRIGVHLDCVATSPLLRARQTAEELLANWPAPLPALDLCEALAPGSKPRKLARYLWKKGAGSVALVGHIPNLAEHAAWLIGSKKAQLQLAKAGAARIECDKLPAKGSGILTWLVTPAWCEAVTVPVVTH